MTTLDTARLLAMKRRKRESLLLIRESAQKNRTEAHEQDNARSITSADLWLMKVTAEINRANDEIFALEQELGITREGESAGAHTGAV